MAHSEDLLSERDARARTAGPAPGRHTSATGNPFLVLMASGHFRVLWMTGAFGFLAQQMQTVAQGYLAYAISGSAIALGAVSLASGLVMVPFSLFAGAIADRVDKRIMVAATQAVMATTTLAIAVLVATGQIAIWHLAVAGVVQAIVFTFNIPARQAMLPVIVSKERLGNAVALTSIGGNFSRIIGPSVAGVLMGLAAVGIQGTYFLIAALIFMVTILSLFLPSARAASDANREPFLQSIVAGFRFVRTTPLLLLMFGIGFIPITLGMPSQMLLPVFNEVVLAQSVEVLGLLYASMGVGALVGSLYIASRARQGDSVMQQLVFGGLFGLTLALFSFARDYRAALALIFLMGIVSQCYMTVNMTFFITSTPPEYVGRVMSIQMLTMAAMPLGTFPLSALADAIGIAQTFTIAGSIIVIAMAAVAFTRPRGRPLP